MREILFRGISKKHRTFEYGCLIQSMCKTYIGNTFGNYQDHWCEVIPETVGQFTGLLDNNGKKIFEGDILSLGFDSRKPFPIFWENDLFMWSIPDYDYVNDMPPLHFLNCHNNSIEIIGNIHDNPQLL